MSRVRSRGDRHIRKSATPISLYTAVQIGANAALGGVNHGLFSEAYHVGMELIVHTVDPNPGYQRHGDRYDQLDDVDGFHISTEYSPHI